MGYGGGGGGGGMHPQHAGMMPSHHHVPGVPYGLVPISANGGKWFFFQFLAKTLNFLSELKEKIATK